MSFSSEIFDTHIQQLTDPARNVVELTAELGLYSVRENQPQLRDGSRPIVVVTGPSRSGKDTIIQSLLAIDQRFARVRTATTRLRRAEEAENDMVWMRSQRPDETRRDYQTALAEEYGLVECTEHNGQVYGLPRASLTSLDPGLIPVLNTDIVGIAKLSDALREQFSLVSFIVCPEDAAELQRRMEALGTDTESRLEMAQHYLEGAPAIVNYVIHNRTATSGEEAAQRISQQMLRMLGGIGVLPLLAKQ